MSEAMPFTDRIEVFASLGEMIKTLDHHQKEDLISRVQNQNNWFTETSILSALKGISMLLDRDNLHKWLSQYSLPTNPNPKTVGILMAGNIPGVGFHDLLCVLVSGHKAAIKLSSADSVFLRWIIDCLIKIDPEIESCILIEDMLKGKDAYIATGSDNSARYFSYYFGKYPSIIRSNRTSVAILTGEESDEELEKLGWDIFLYFGLGCRNVSKIYVKNVDQLQRLLGILDGFTWVASNHKYLNNYEYNKSIYLVNRDPHLDNGFLLLRESKEIVSPIGVLFYEFYASEEILTGDLGQIEDKIQCVVGNANGAGGRVAFGTAQFPGPWEYADNMDTMKFLLALH
jgi:hypothetical protein